MFVRDLGCIVVTFITYLSTICFRYTLDPIVVSPHVGIHTCTVTNNSGVARNIFKSHDRHRNRSTNTPQLPAFQVRPKCR